MSTLPSKPRSGNSENKRPPARQGRQPEKPRPRRTTEPPTLCTIVCSMCGKEDQVPFEPTRGTAVLCKDCFAVKKKRKYRNREIMRKVAGRFKVICENCGVEVELTYRRATEPVKLCDTCYEKLKGKVPDNKRNIRIQVTTSIVCCRCGKREYVNFVPEDDSKVLCKDCYRMESEGKGSEES